MNSSTACQPRLSPLRARRLRGPRAVLLGLFAVVTACTLTSDELEPPLVVDVPLGTGEPNPDPVPSVPDAGSVLPPSLDAGTEPPCSGSDCTPAEPLPLEPACDDGLQNGDESGVDCGGSCPRRCATGAGCGGPADCASGVCDGSSCVAPSCADGVFNGDEAALDCGESCGIGCAAGAPCAGDAGCAAPLICLAETSVCTAASCSDGVLDGAELLVDCGGGECQGCPDGTSCNADPDCLSGVCDDDSCAAPSCTDGVQNGEETDADCGSACDLECEVGEGCAEPEDCETGVCTAQQCGAGLALCCQPPRCNDGVQNGSETDVDCGNAACGPCGLGSPCDVDGDCDSGFCQLDVCTDPGTCADNQRNGRETDVDCGGADCEACGDLAECDSDADCADENCDVRGLCISCTDGEQNSLETDVDCGGTDPACARCNTGQRCGNNDDCQPGQLCIAAVCGP